MADYQLRLAEETKEKISRIDVNGQSDLQKSVRAFEAGGRRSAASHFRCMPVPFLRLEDR
jgi:hypothetical protein